MKSGFRATRSPFVNILAFFNVVASRQISPHQFCKGTMFIHICKIFLIEFRNQWQEWSFGTSVYQAWVF